MKRAFILFLLFFATAIPSFSSFAAYPWYWITSTDDISVYVNTEEMFYETAADTLSVTVKTTGKYNGYDVATKGMALLNYKTNTLTWLNYYIYSSQWGFYAKHTPPAPSVFRPDSAFVTSTAALVGRDKKLKQYIQRRKTAPPDYPYNVDSSKWEFAGSTDGANWYVNKKDIYYNQAKNRVNISVLYVMKHSSYHCGYSSSIDLNTNTMDDGNVFMYDNRTLKYVSTVTTAKTTTINEGSINDSLKITALKLLGKLPQDTVAPNYDYKEDIKSNPGHIAY